MRISDWSSDVCSSDLPTPHRHSTAEDTRPMTMLRDPSPKYRAFPQVPLENRQWPARTTTRAPIWLSTDLRAGNQALIDPMDAEKKTRFFDLLVKSGLKDIEVGFPPPGAPEQPDERPG